MDDDELVTIPKAQQLLGWSRSEVLNACAARELEGKRVGNLIAITTESITQLITKKAPQPA